MNNKYLKYDNIINKLELLLPHGKKTKYSISNVMRVLFLAKFTKTVKAIKLLDEKGYYEDSNVLVRTLFEIMITILYCEMNPDINYERYDEYNCISKERYFSLIKKYNHSIDEEKLAELNESKIAFFDKYNINKNNNRHTWNNLTFSATVRLVAERYGTDYLLIYDCIYCLTSEYIHTSSQCLQKNYFKIENNKYCYSSDPIIRNDEMNIINNVDIISNKILEIYIKGNYFN